MSAQKDSTLMKAREPIVRPHQPGEEAFEATLPEELDWKPFPAFPPSVRLAIIVGQPAQPGPYTIRVRVPAMARS